MPADAPNPLYTGIPPRAALALAFLLFPAALAYGLAVYAPCDDTYIFLVYAKNFLAGNGLTYNGVRVEGFSSPLWLFGVTLLGATGLPLPFAAEALGALAGLGALAATFALGRACGLSTRRALLPALLLAATGDLAFYMVTGMETALFCALATGVVAAGAAPRPERTLGSWRLPLVGALATLTRPEGALFVGLTLAALALRTRKILPAALCGLRTAAILLPVEVAQYLYYGDWLPNTWYAKAGAPFANLRDGFHYLEYAAPRYAIVVVPLVLSLGLAVARRRARALRDVALPLVVAVVWLVYLLSIGGDTLVGARFLVPIVPAVYVALVRLARGLPFRIAAAAAAAIAVALVAGYLATDTVTSHRMHWREAAEMRRGVARFLAQTFPADTLVALAPAGMIPFYSGLPALDTLGLNDAHIARRGRRDRDLPYGHQVGDGAYVLSRRPGVILFGQWGGRRPGALVSDREVFESPVFRRRYVPFELPNGAWIHVRGSLRGVLRDRADPRGRRPRGSGTGARGPDPRGARRR